MVDLLEHTTRIPQIIPTSPKRLGRPSTRRCQARDSDFGSGVGVCVAANKIPGIRAGMCHDTYSAHQGVEHDDMNVLVLGARIIGSEVAFELAHSFVCARFLSEEERFVRRYKKVLAIEAKYMCGDGSANPA